MPQTGFPFGIGAPGLGISVCTSPLALPTVATSPYTIFTITGGPIYVTSLFGVVTTVIQTQACNLKLSAKVGSMTAVDVAANLNVSALAVGTVLSAITSFATALSGVSTGVIIDMPGASGSPTQFIVGAASGVNSLITVSTSATNTGAIQWFLTYIPFDCSPPIDPNGALASGNPVTQVVPIA